MDAVRSDSPTATREWDSEYDNGPLYGPFCSLACMDGWQWAKDAGHIDGRYYDGLVATGRCPYCGKPL